MNDIDITSDDGSTVDDSIFGLQNELVKLTLENENLKKIIEHKNEIIMQLENHIFETETLEHNDNVDNAIENTIDNTIDSTLNKTPIQHLSYKSIEAYLIKHGRFTHPRIVRRFIMFNT